MLKYEDVLTAPEKVDFVFQAMDSWRQSGNFPVGGIKLMMNPIQRIQHIYRLNLFTKLYFMEYVTDVVIPDTQ